MPKFVEEGWEYLDEETKEWKLKPDAPEWAKKEFQEYYSVQNPTVNEDGTVTQY